MWSKHLAFADAIKEQEELNNKYAIKKYIENNRIEILNKVSNSIGWNKPLKSFKDLENTLSDLRDSSKRLNTILHLVFKGKSIRSALPWASVIIILACLVYLIGINLDINFFANLTKLCAAIGGVAGTIISFIAAPLSKANSLLKNFSDKVVEVVDEYKNSEGDNLVNIRKEHLSIQEKIAHLREKVAKLEKDNLSLDPFERLTSFIEERAIVETYRSQQGIISLVRRDFETLSKLMSDWTKNKNNVPKDIKPVDRIILYIDDLDRCSPKIVVQTLEAIHLLLALDLFVVIVGVDSRWLLRSLDVYYSTLLSSQENKDEEYRISTPQNYLEKIFQITYAVSPMGENGFCRYVDYLSGYDAVNPSENVDLKSTENKDGESVSDKKKDKNQEPISDKHGDLMDGSDININNENQVDITADNKQIENQKDPIQEISKIRSLSISKTEKEYLKRLYPFIQTPRIAKKIVNVYRIFKAKTPLSELDSLEKEKGRHQAILMLLSILFDYPQLSETLFKCLSEKTIVKDPNNNTLYQGIMNLAKSLIDDDMKKSSFKKDESGMLSNQGDEFKKRYYKLIIQAEELTKLSEIVKLVDKQLTLKACEQEALEVSRYSLVTGQVWHTWHIPKDE